MKTPRLAVLFMSLALILVLVSMPFFTSCSSSTPTTTAAPTTTTAPTTTAAPAPTSSAPAPTTTAPAPTTSAPPPSTAKAVVLKYAPSTLNATPMIGQTLVVTNQCKLLETRTNGQIKIDIYWGQTLAKATELSAGVASGLIDMTHLRPYGEPGKLPLSTIGEMPGISDDLYALSWAYYDLVRQEPILSELNKYKSKTVYTLFTQEVDLISRVPIRSLADLKGKKIASGGIAGEELKQLGAVTLAMSPVEQSEGLLRGTIDGISAPVDAMSSFKFYDSGKYVTRIALGPRIQPIVINQDTWNKLPADVQKVFNDSVKDLIDISYKDIIIVSNEKIWKEFADAKVEVIELSAADKAELKKIQSAYGDKWAADQEAAGLPGKKVLADYRALTEKYAQTSPYKK
jgi:TRAP-type C4-dicarboxylate transport system substrate-binding protein